MRAKDVIPYFYERLSDFFQYAVCLCHFFLLYLKSVYGGSGETFDTYIIQNFSMLEKNRK